MKNLKQATARTLEAVHTHTHTHTSNLNNKTNIINKGSVILSGVFIDTG